jgi:tRNA pseudouridine synthase 10
MVLVQFDREISEEKLKSVLKDLIGTVEQRTPTRVSHRRADKVRIRKVYSAEVEEVLENTARITIHSEGGLYVKELVSSDDGRTKPSLADALGVGAKVIELDVINVGEK